MKPVIGPAVPPPAGFTTSHGVAIAATKWHHIAFSAAGSDASNKTDAAVPAGFANFHGVTVESMIWLDKTATVRNQQHFDDVGQRKYYVDMFRLQAPSVSAHLPRLHQPALHSSAMLPDRSTPKEPL